MSKQQIKRLDKSDLSRFEMRDIRQKTVEKIEKQIEKHGFNQSRPLLIRKENGDNIVLDGNHRLRALRNLDYSEKVPCIVADSSQSKYKLALESNEDEAVFAPNDLFDYLNTIQKLKEQGKTQKQIAQEMGADWSREKVAQYIQILNKVVTEVLDLAKNHQEGRVTGDVTTVTNFTEGWFRDSGIYDLPEERQEELMEWFTEEEECDVTKKKVKNKVEELETKEEYIDYVNDNLLWDEDREKTQKQEFIEDINKGVFTSQDSLEKAVKQANDEYRKKKQHEIFKGNMFNEIEEIEDNDVDVLLTDPPYNITENEWDKYEEGEFIEFTKNWLKKVLPKIKDSGRVYVFWSQEYMFKFPIELVESFGFNFGNVLIWNYRNNVKPNSKKIYKYTYEPVFYFYGDKAKNLNMPKGEEWGIDKLHRFDVYQVAMPQKNFKEDKKIHPTQKPLKLIKMLIRTGSYRGDRILDPFAGSGTTGEAAKELKRKSYLIEKKPEHVKKIKERLRRVD